MKRVFPYIIICLLLANASCTYHKLDQPCASPQFLYSLTVNATDSCVTNGAIFINGFTGSGYEFSFNGGPFQKEPVFSSVAPGKYALRLKQDDCIYDNRDTAVVTVLPPGPLFTQVRQFISQHCISCHNSGNAQGNVSYSNACSIVLGYQRIMARAVFGNPSPMPTSGLLNLLERNKVTQWVAAGARYTD
jgi:hypothetical protein